MPVTYFSADSYNEFIQLVEALEQTQKNTYILFTSIKSENGEITNGMCDKAEKVIEDFMTQLPESTDVNLVKVLLKEEEVTNGPFRKNRWLRVVKVPTFIRWKGPERLVECECSSVPLLKLVFRDQELPKYFGDQ